MGDDIFQFREIDFARLEDPIQNLFLTRVSQVEFTKVPIKYRKKLLNSIELGTIGRRMQDIKRIHYSFTLISFVDGGIIHNDKAVSLRKKDLIMLFKLRHEECKTAAGHVILEHLVTENAEIRDRTDDTKIRGSIRETDLEFLALGTPFG